MRAALVAALVALVVGCGSPRDESSLDSSQDALTLKSGRNCKTGYASCGTQRNQCETNLLVSVNDCGWCGHVCDIPNAIPVCSNGACAIGSCNAGYVLHDGSCIPRQADCGRPNATAATQTWNPVTGSYGTCTATACSAYYVLSGQACIPQSVACGLANGTGTQVWAGTSYGSCVATSCNAGYVAFGGACIPQVIDCTLAGATSATQTWDGASGGYRVCTASACSAGLVPSNGLCIPAVASCSILNGSGVEVWNGTAYGACTASACDSGHRLSNGACVPKARCAVVNGVRWCIDPSSSGAGCNEVCANAGLPLTIDYATWFSSQNTYERCQAIAAGLGLPPYTYVSSWTHGCAQYAAQGNGLMCSDYVGCPANHVSETDIGSQAVCPCQ